MPFIDVKTNKQVSKTEEIALKQALGEAIAILPGKSERWLMLDIHDQSRMYFHGDDAPCAMLQVQVFGKINQGKCEELTAEICRIMDNTLQIAPENTYVKYEEISLWGWNSQNF
jgi:phenylpyruvate tautomerase PptA (4-oxalocrotonate tautomerase family)